LTIERGLRVVAGVVLLLSALLAALHNPLWIILTVLVGLNPLKSAFTNWCPMVWVLAQLGMRPCVAEKAAKAVSSSS